MPETDPLAAADAAPGAVRFTEQHWLRHVLVFAALAVLCGLMYGRVTGVDFQFDDLPNITECAPMAMRTLSLGELERAVRGAEARNRVLVSASFALQHWAAQFLPRRIDLDPPRPDFLPWQMRMFNYCVHLLAGFAVYLLVLRLVQLPRAEKHLRPYAWGFAALTALAWFCHPVQTQAVTYVVQRAASLSTLFYCLAFVCYLEARAARTRTGAGAFLGLMTLAALGAVFSKEIGVTLLVAVPMLEWWLIAGRGPRARGAALRWTALAAVCLMAVDALGVRWFLGGPRDETRAERPASERRIDRAAGRLWEQLVTWVVDEKVVSRKVQLTPRQRLLTQARVVAMYQSLLLLPLPSRQSLDYDFLESKSLFTPGEYGRARDWTPLLLVLGVALATALAPGRWRARVFLLLLAALTLWDAAWLDAARPPPGLADVWRRPWPVPALVWHLLALGFAALYSYRRPLLAFAIGFFYLGHVVESTVLALEVVFEHRLYLPSIGLVLALALLLLEAFHPPREEELGPRPWGGAARA